LLRVNNHQAAQNSAASQPAENPNEAAGNITAPRRNANELGARIKSAFNTVRTAFQHGREESSPPAPAGGDSDNRMPRGFAMPEILGEIAHHLDIVDVFELSKTARRPYWILMRQRKAFKDSVRNYYDQTLVRTGCKSAKKLYEHVSSGSPFQEKDTTVRELREALRLPDHTPAMDTLRKFIRAVRYLPRSSRCEADMQYQAIYLARALLRASPLWPNHPRTVRILNGLAEEAIRVAPRLSKDRHWRQTGKETGEMMAIVKEGTSTAGLILGSPFLAAAAAGKTLVKEDKNCNRMLNLAIEAMQRLQRGQLNDELAKAITEHLVANPDTNGKHLNALRDEFVRLARPDQINEAAPQLRAIGWM
jgi:hypothetical protein